MTPDSVAARKMSTTATASQKLLGFLDQLGRSKIWYRMHHVRDSVMIDVAIPGERWEVEFFEDGHVEVERFMSPGEMDDETVLDRLFEEENSGPSNGSSAET